LKELTDPVLPRPPTVTSTDAARLLAGLPFVGPYLVKSMLAVLTLTDRVEFDAGVMPAGSYSAVRCLLTADYKLVKKSLWPWSEDPQNTHRHITALARMEGCTWQDMQGALCYWAPWRRYLRPPDYCCVRAPDHAPDHSADERPERSERESSASAA